MSKLRKVSPCKGCELRKMFCHEDCEQFKEFQETMELIRERKSEYQREQNDYLGVVTHRLRHRR